MSKKIAVVAANGRAAQKIISEAVERGLDVAILRAAKDVKWTYVSPAADFQADGQKTGKYLLGGEEFMLNDRQQSVISYADYAVAMIDVIEKGSHIQQRISVVEA